MPSMETLRSATCMPVIAPFLRYSGHSSSVALLPDIFYSLIPRVNHAIRVLFVFALVFTALTVVGQAQTSQSGTTTARLNKELLVSAASESVQILDAISITYTMSTTSAGTQLTVMCRYNGSGEGDTSGRPYTLTGNDQ